MTGIKPAVSVIVPAYRAWEALPRCLDALRKQSGGVAFETIVVASGEVAAEAPLAARFPEVRFLLSAGRRFPGAARNLGAQVARGDIFLFLDADCALAKDGLARVVAGHAQHAAPVIGGCADQGETATGAGWGYYFASVAPWLVRPADEPIPVPDLATPCYSIKRWAFERYGPFAEARYCEDTLLCWQIQAAGHALLLDPGLRVRHDGIDALGPVLRRKFRHGAAFAVLRAQTQGWGWARRRWQALGAPLVPWVLLYRIGRAVSQAGCYRRRFWLSLPYTALAVLAWALGEAVGLWFGAVD
ncbi:glycosyltransferase family 2 protein [Methylomagnum ishizawai]|uniref:glycosyltransferase family 2 protein n=1 Tax=Methylomagnum ishizawai TaxID=1760988 RepID=UPI001C32838E|nr:glycosyltransferase [Methylomagnum ishizawai]BBL77330.1 hypothetical protein MishRS11D_44280 [Methylomagnum ishizawai]